MPACPGTSGEHREPLSRPRRLRSLILEEYGSAAPEGRACRPVIIRQIRDPLQAIGFRQPGYAIPSIAGPSVQSTIGPESVKTAIQQRQPGTAAAGHFSQSLRDGSALTKPRQRQSDEEVDDHPAKPVRPGHSADAATLRSSRRTPINTAVQSAIVCGSASWKGLWCEFNSIA